MFVYMQYKDKLPEQIHPNYIYDDEEDFHTKT